MNDNVVLLLPRIDMPNPAANQTHTISDWLLSCMIEAPAAVSSERADPKSEHQRRQNALLHAPSPTNWDSLTKQAHQELQSSISRCGYDEQVSASSKQASLNQIEDFIRQYGFVPDSVLSEPLKNALDDLRKQGRMIPALEAAADTTTAVANLINELYREYGLEDEKINESMLLLFERLILNGQCPLRLAFNYSAIARLIPKITEDDRYINLLRFGVDNTEDSTLRALMANLLLNELLPSSIAPSGSLNSADEGPPIALRLDDEGMKAFYEYVKKAEEQCQIDREELRAKIAEDEPYRDELIRLMRITLKGSHQALLTNPLYIKRCGDLIKPYCDDYLSLLIDNCINSIFSETEYESRRGLKPSGFALDACKQLEQELESVLEVDEALKPRLSDLLDELIYLADGNTQRLITLIGDLI